MAYPSKTDRGLIISATLTFAEREGPEALTLRRLAAEIGVTPNAIYRYFRNLDVLVAAAADAVAERLHHFVSEGMAMLPANLPTEHRIRRLLALHSEFLATKPALYQILFSASQEAEAELPEPRWRGRLFRQSLEVIAPLVGPEDADAATMSLWSLMHGMWGLSRVGVLAENSREAIERYAIDALIVGVRDAPRPSDYGTAASREPFTTFDDVDWSVAGPDDLRS